MYQSVVYLGKGDRGVICAVFGNLHVWRNSPCRMGQAYLLRVVLGFFFAIIFPVMYVPHHVTASLL